LLQATQALPIYPVNPLNAKLNPICHLLALLGGATIVVISRIRVKGSSQDEDEYGAMLE
jgi:hypothetical protein